MFNPAVQKFVVLEGDEFSGKSSVRKALVERLEALNVPHQVFREPGGTPFGEEIREILLRKGDEQINQVSDILLHQAYRAQNVREIIKPALEAGKLVLSERFIISTYCLNVVPYLETNPELQDLFMGTLPFVTQGIPEPITFMLRLPEEERMKRADGRKLDRYEDMPADHVAKVSKAYRELQLPSMVEVDATQSIEKIVDFILDVLTQFDDRETQRLADEAQRKALMAEAEVPTPEEPVAKGSSEAEESQPFDLETALEAYAQTNIVPELFPRLTQEGDAEYQANAMKYWRELAKKIVAKIFKQTGEDQSIFQPHRVGQLNSEIHSLFHYHARFEYMMDELRKDGAFGEDSTETGVTIEDPAV
ncbi:thymidylate kinase [Pseudomonas phage PhiPA3]|uniref:dTMP kinase n=1 Tax=Pseudomonas phage PhiPA3 TaxID=998086 RepID=F8SJ66_BPPA3|nr:thymidylate kinase [Pseudomonas phage PhiPA3]AEH03646.1 thymidylate kinase [Pseudomonas phage PhiPA3]